MYTISCDYAHNILRLCTQHLATNVLCYHYILSYINSLVKNESVHLMYRILYTITYAAQPKSDEKKIVPSYCSYVRFLQRDAPGGPHTFGRAAHSRSINNAADAKFEEKPAVSPDLTKHRRCERAFRPKVCGSPGAVYRNV